MPYNWAFYEAKDNELQGLKNDDVFTQAKDETLIKFLMIPRQVFTKLADHFISKPELKREFIEWMINRNMNAIKNYF